MIVTLSNFVYLLWPWVGFGGAVAILILLFGTHVLRSDLSRPAWFDCTWLAWLCSATYLLHNTEEYGIDMLGNFHQFPTTMIEMIGIDIPEPFYMAVNISMFWFVSTIAAGLSKKYPALCIGMACEEIINAISHIFPLVTGLGYTAGTLTAVIVFLPVASWTIYACVFKGPLNIKVLALMFGVAILNHLILMSSIMLYRGTVINVPILVIMQIINAGIALLLWLAIDRSLRKST